jgi:hypothetical protein
MTYSHKRSPKAEKIRNERKEQKDEAYFIRHSFGLFHDNILKETIQCQTPEEVLYYLKITYPDGVYMSSVPETTIQGLVLNQKLVYQINNE